MLRAIVRRSDVRPVLVTGSNGKTTTVRFAAAAMRGEGAAVTTNFPGGQPRRNGGLGDDAIRIVNADDLPVAAFVAGPGLDRGRDLLGRGLFRDGAATLTTIRRHADS